METLLRLVFGYVNVIGNRNNNAFDTEYTQYTQQISLVNVNRSLAIYRRSLSGTPYSIRTRIFQHVDNTLNPNHDNNYHSATPQLGYTKGSDIWNTASDNMSNHRCAKQEHLDCVVCMDRHRSAYLEPCGHGVLCSDCSVQIVKTKALCPICKQSIQNVKPLFL